MRNLLDQLVSNIITHEILNPLILPFNKIIKRVVKDTYVYHKYCRSRCGEYTLRVVLEGKPLRQTTSSRFPKDNLSVLKQALSRP